jgi:hypothetical protein
MLHTQGGIVETEEDVFVPVPEPDQDGELDLDTYFSDLASDDGDRSIDFRRALECRPRIDDERVSLASIQVTDVQANGDTIVVYYNSEFFAYYGCSDQDGTYVQDGLEAVGHREGEFWIFPAHVYPEPLAPNEEL